MVDATRRRLLRSGLAGAALSLLPVGARAAEPAPRLVVVLLRGAVDGLSIVVPYSDERYYQSRSSIAIPRPGSDGGALDLDGRFGLHPALAALQPLWQAGRLGFVQASGSPDPTRSHFDAQDYMETATPGLKRTTDGWLNRALLELPARDALLPAVSLGPVLPRICAGSANVTNIPLGRAATGRISVDRPEVGSAFDRLYGDADSGALGAAYRAGRAAHGRVIADLTDDEHSEEMRRADNGAPPPQGFALDARQLARLMRRNPSLQLAFMQLGGWDTHFNQGGSSGQLANRLKPLGEGLLTLATELGPLFDDTLVVVMSEFGRTVRQNGTGGTDHGHGNVMWLLGGGLDGGKVWTDWPGLDDTALYEGRDLAVTTDFRSVLAQLCAQHLRLDDAALSRVFPNAPAASRYKLLRA